MDIATLTQIDDNCWEMPCAKGMLVPARFFGAEAIILGLDDAVARQISNVARLPGIVRAALTMPDAHMGYGFPIGGVAAFDATEGGVVSAGGVGYDIACGVRTLTTDIHWEDLVPLRLNLADALFSRIPSGVGSIGAIRLKGKAMDAMLAGGAVWAVKQGFGEQADLAHIEDDGQAAGADPGLVSTRAKERMTGETGTLGSGNHYLEVQRVEEIFDPTAAQVYGLRKDDAAISIHCGSRGLGHQIATDYLTLMHKQAAKHGLTLPDPELACAPIQSSLGQRYLAAMRAGINCALANRQVLTHLVREVFAEFFPTARLRLLYDVSHNTCKEEVHTVDAKPRQLFVHRKGATRAWGSNHPGLAGWMRGVGQPMLVGGSMGTASYVLAGTDASLERSFGSACHGAGRALSRSQAVKRFKGQAVMEALERQDVVLRAKGYKGISEEAPGAYKDIDQVAASTVGAGLARMVARMRPLVCVKG